LHVATKWGKANSVNLLLDNGAKIDAKTRVIYFFDLFALNKIQN
jgi:hypothetical protein